jgi:hypothetical protein
MILVPGTPASTILQLENERWKVVIDNLPSSCSDAAWTEGQLKLAGSVDGKLKIESRPYNL